MVARNSFRLTGDTADLHTAVQRLRAAVAASRPEHVDHSLYVSNLSSTLALLHETTGDLAPLEESVAILERAIHNSPPEDHWRAELQSALGDVALRFHLRTDDRDALTTAIAASRKALELAPADDVTRPMNLNQLGLALRNYHALTRDPAHGEEAARMLREAAASAAWWSRPVGLHNLAQLGIAQYDETGDLSFLDEADRATAEGILLTDGDSPIHAALQRERGIVLWRRHQRDPDDDLLEAAFCALRSAADSPSSSAMDRLAAASRWGRYAQAARRTDEALRAYEYAATLLVHLAPRSLEREDREHHLGRITGLAADAAAAALDAGKPERAVELPGTDPGRPHGRSHRRPGRSRSSAPRPP